MSHIQSHTQVVSGYIIPDCLPVSTPKVKRVRPAFWFWQKGLVITFENNTTITATGPFNFTKLTYDTYRKVETSNRGEIHSGEYHAYPLKFPGNNEYETSLFVLNVNGKKCNTGNDKNGVILGGGVKRPISSTISSIQRKHHTKPKNPRSHPKRNPSHRKRKTQKRKKT